MDEKTQIEEMCNIAHQAVMTCCCPCDRCMFKDKPITCDECAIAHELYNAGYRKQSEDDGLQEHIVGLIPETIDTDAGTHIYLLYQERLKIAKAITDGLMRFPGESTK